MKDFNINLLKKCIDVNAKDINAGEFELSGIEEKIWLKKDDITYLYKIDDENNLGFYELIVSYLCHKIGVNCVNVYPAVDNINKQTGVIVESYLTDKHETQISLAKLVEKYSDYFVRVDVKRLGYSVEEIEEIVEKLKLLGFEVDNNLIESLKETCLIDYLLFQYDRHFGNIEFLFSKENGKDFVRLAPMFDNGRCLNYDCSTLGDIIYMMREGEVCLSMSNRQSSDIGINLYSKNIAYFICKEIQNNNKLEEVYSRLLALDFDKMVDEIVELYPAKIRQNKIEVVKKTYKIRLNLIKKYLKIAKLNKDDAFLYKSVKDIRIKVPKGIERASATILSTNAYDQSMISLKNRNRIVIDMDEQKDDDIKELIW